MNSNNMHFLNDQISVSKQGMIPGTLKRAYNAANLLIKETPFLQVESVKFNRGRFYSWAVDHAIELLIKNGTWDCDYRWAGYAQPTGKFLEVRLPQSVLSISRVVNQRQQPRDVEFRTNLRLSNEPYLFSEFEEEMNVNGLPHILLVHGGKHPDFAHLGIPNPNHKKGYLYYSDNLMLRPHIILDERVPMEDTDYADEDLMQLKQELDKWVKDNETGL